jgi:LysM repeat protein
VDSRSERQSRAVSSEEGGIFYHTVERGQTVYTLSQMYGVSEDEIYRLNPSSRQGIKVGEKLRISQSRAVVSGRSSSSGDAYTYHTVQPGETMYGLSRTYGVTVESISAANPGLTYQTFAIGKTIRIPASGGLSVPATRTVVKTTEYVVKKKETLYSICKQFNISVDELLEQNPDIIKSGLRAGDVLFIPAGTVTVPVSGRVEDQYFNLDSLMQSRKEIRKVSTAKIALLLPFQVSDAKHSAHYVEYYEGFLMAVDSMRNSGLSVDITVHDIGDNSQQITKVLEDKSLLNSNLLIGGVTNEQIAQISDFALKNKIKYVVPTSSKCEKQTLTNAYLFQINSGYQHLYSFATTRVCNNFRNHNIIILNTNDRDAKTQFITTLKLDLKEQKIPFKELTYREETFSADITAALIAGRGNLVIPVSSSLEALNKIRPTLRSLSDVRMQYQLTLFGYPEWQMYTDECLEDFFALNTHIYTSFYANNLSPEVQRFNARYKYWYKKNIIDSYPKYAMLGFDTGVYFISAINRYGVNFENYVTDIRHKSIQTGFRFSRVNNWGGFLNTNIYIVRFAKDFTITRSE